MTRILGIKLSSRIENAGKFQGILSQYGCNIKTRIGLHDLSCGVCSPYGIILLELVGDEKSLNNLFDDLQTLASIKMDVIEL